MNVTNQCTDSFTTVGDCSINLIVLHSSFAISQSGGGGAVGKIDFEKDGDNN